MEFTAPTLARNVQAPTALSIRNGTRRFGRLRSATILASKRANKMRAHIPEQQQRKP